MALQPNRIVTHAIRTRVLKERTNLIVPNLSKNAICNLSQPGNCLTRQSCDLVNYERTAKNQHFALPKTRKYRKWAFRVGLNCLTVMANLQDSGRIGEYVKS